MIETPGFFAFPSGHATQAFMVAELLRVLTDAHANGGGDHRLGPTLNETMTQLRRQAERIATNRVVAGLHYPIDSAGGQLLGHCLAGYLIDRCTGKADWKPLQMVIDPQYYLPITDFDPRPLFAGIEAPSQPGVFACALLPSASGAPPAMHGTPYNPTTRARSLSPLSWLWHQAAYEWHRPGVA